MPRVPFDSPTTDYTAKRWVGATPVIQKFIDDGWRPIHPDINGKPETCVSIYFGRGGNGPAGTTHTATVIDERRACPQYRHLDGWSIVKLDKWGGTGSRAPIAMGSIDELDELERRMQSIERRQMSAKRRKK